MKNVFVAVPTRGAIQWATVTRLQEIRDKHGLPPILYQPGNLSVAQTRNRIVKQFLAGTWDTLVMVDDDIVPSPHFLERVLPMAANVGMVALPHPMPHPKDPSQIILTAFDHDLRPIDLRNGFNPCAYVATGCVAISRAALKAVGPAPFRISSDPDAPITSDDFLFCDDLHDAGFHVGAWWDGWYCDHHTVAQLAPLYEARSLA